MESFTLSQQIETDGYNRDCGKTWIYPINYPVRDYQYNISKEALFKNTMVCLPTGLGKTFIAAVVMYNFFRWYPNGKIIFMAPTKPLVKQQIDACYDIVGIPKNVTAELTGTNVQTTRDEVWDEKRVFFITPQVLQNDLERINRLGKQIKCLVFDEAHRASKNYAYCDIINKLLTVNKYFRVLALTASPGNTIVDVCNVCKNLLIAHIEIRTEACFDVIPYLHKRTIQKIVIPLDGKLREVYDQYLIILDRYLRPLKSKNVIHGNTCSISKGRFLFTLKEIQSRFHGNERKELIKAGTICQKLYYAFELLTRHGMRSFLKYFEEHLEDPLIKNITEIPPLIDNIREYLGPPLTVAKLPDGSFPKISDDVKFGHPKFYKLTEILLHHFEEKTTKSKVIIFCEYVETVSEIYTCLVRHAPLIKPKMFLGQGSITQKQQTMVIASFRNSLCNTLISTCIGEEGLDIGEVDIVVCFDIANKSAVRMIQRIGRTGRQRDGRVIMLATQGLEEKILEECLQNRKTIATNIKCSKELREQLNKDSPRMVPDDINPQCMKMAIVVATEKPKTTKTTSIKSFFENMSNSQSASGASPFTELLPSAKYCFNNNLEEHSSDTIDLSKHANSQRSLHSSKGFVGASQDSVILVNLMQMADSLRFNIPHTQVDNKANLNYKQSDIRDMFTKISSTTTSSIQIPSQLDMNNKILNDLNENLNIFMAHSFTRKDCPVCTHLFSCNEINLKHNNQRIVWTECNLSIINSITDASLTTFMKRLNNVMDDDSFNDDLDDIMAEMDIDDILNKHHNGNESPSTLQNNLRNNQSDIIDENSFEIPKFVSPNNKNEQFKNSGIEHNVNGALSKIQDNDQFDIIDENTFEVPKFVPPNNLEITNIKNAQFNNSNFEHNVNSLSSKIQDDNNQSDIIIEDSFEIPKFVPPKIPENTITNKAQPNKTVVADFLKLDSIDEVFVSPEKNDVSETPLFKTPEKHKIIDECESDGSPIISCSYDARKKIKTHKMLLSQKKLASTSKPTQSNNQSPDLFDDSFSPIKKEPITNKQMEICHIPANHTNNQTAIAQKKNLPKRKLEISDIFSEDIFGEESIKNLNDLNLKHNSPQIQKTTKKQLKMDDIFSEDFLGAITESPKKTVKEDSFINKSPIIAGNKFNDPIKGNIQITESPKQTAKEDSFIYKSPIIAGNKINNPTKSNLQITESPKETAKEDSFIYKSPIIAGNKMNNETKSNLQINEAPKIIAIEDSFISKSPIIAGNKINATKSSLQRRIDRKFESIFEIDSFVDDSFSCSTNIFSSNKENQFGNASQQSNSNLGMKDILDEPKKNNSTILKISKPNLSRLMLKRPSNSLLSVGESDTKTNSLKTVVSSNLNDSTNSTSSLLDTVYDDNLNNFIELCDEDIFEEDCIKRPSKSSKILKTSDDDTFEEPTQEYSPEIKKPKSKRRKENQFIDLEAEVSSDETISDDECSQVSSHSSFVNDNDSADLLDKTNMRKHYLRSVRSPKRYRGGYKIPENLPPLHADIFSQAVDPDEDNSYLEDSFCVEDVSYLTQKELSELEVAEQLLEQKKRKRRRVYTLDSDESS